MEDIQDFHGVCISLNYAYRVYGLLLGDCWLVTSTHGMIAASPCVVHRSSILFTIMGSVYKTAVVVGFLSPAIGEPCNDIRFALKRKPFWAVPSTSE
jgi:hypothetical protein